jgi:hypothetical protein
MTKGEMMNSTVEKVELISNDMFSQPSTLNRVLPEVPDDTC